MILDIGGYSLFVIDKRIFKIVPEKMSNLHIYPSVSWRGGFPVMRDDDTGLYTDLQQKSVEELIEGITAGYNLETLTDKLDLEWYRPMHLQ